MSTLHMKIVPDNTSIWEKHPTYINAKINEDCGLDIPMCFTVNIPANSKAYTVDLGFKAEQNYGYMLVPRSSISKTPLRLANSIGIIDKKYRGKVMVKLDNNSDEDFTLHKGQCYFQIVAFNGQLPFYRLAEDVSMTERGEGGFGSTTKNITPETRDSFEGLTSLSSPISPSSPRRTTSPIRKTTSPIKRTTSQTSDLDESIRYTADIHIC